MKIRQLSITNKKTSTAVYVIPNDYLISELATMQNQCGEMAIVSVFRVNAFKESTPLSETDLRNITVEHQFIHVMYRPEWNNRTNVLLPRCSQMRHDDKTGVRYCTRENQKHTIDKFRQDRFKINTIQQFRDYEIIGFFFQFNLR